MTIAVYPGSFDPVTFGHLDIVERGARIFDKVIIAVMVNPHKNPLFSVEERKELIRRAVEHIPNVEVDSFPGLLVNYVQKKNASVIIKGLRAVSDFESELQMASMNKHMYNDAETFFLPTSTKYSHLSSSIIKEIARHGGPISDFVPPHVEQAIREKYSL
ncbi:phosphopantetheine adenylyltransferase [Collibacillus ludicampi]|uniref:Phosphopantetheine adenylyltransferase n=1 Tax=Collibacillus ludicampi TaxID=2771369 RepID=A0AAV4LIF2_9BACL|nr:pantetheine-phosphate adenylyltransferase [Collibacillus ludicampi]GIM47543.1 phosphopantetheine adenylyltransferase [Collibacillus ludicampi]